jgi:hypothetical protein
MKPDLAVRRLGMAPPSASAALVFAIIDIVSFFLYLALLVYSPVSRLVRGRNPR